MASILVIEDDEVSGRLLSHMLRKRGHEVHVCTRSADAWRRMDETPADLVILDTELEGEHGWEVLERIRGDIILGQLPVIVYSSNSRRDVVQRYIALGVQSILIKPYSNERMHQEIDRAMVRAWRDRLFEAADTVQARTGLTSGGLARLYRDAAAEIEAAMADLQALREDPGNVTGTARLAALKSCAINIGFHLLATLAEAAVAAATAGDAQKVGALIDRLPVARRLLEVRCGRDADVQEAPEPGAEGGGDPPAAAQAPAA